MARRITGSCSGASSGRLCRSWISFTRFPICSRRGLGGRGFARGGWRWVGGGGVAGGSGAREGRRAEGGSPAEDEPATSPRRAVEQTLTYLRNHQDKMR